MRWCILKFKTERQYKNYLQHNDVAIADKGFNSMTGMWYVVLEKEAKVNFFEKIGSAVDGVLGHVIVKGLETGKKIYNNSPKDCVKNSVSTLKTASGMVKVLMENTKNKIKIVKDTIGSEKKEDKHEKDCD